MHAGTVEIDGESLSGHFTDTVTLLDYARTYSKDGFAAGETVGKLQIDATLAYINGGRVPTAADKKIDSPYNTYLNKGLPAGPISNPGMDSIQAAMKPEKTNYFYYALGDDGVHHFNTNYDAHVNFINSQKLYQK